MSGPHHFPAPEAAEAHPARRQGAGGDGPSASRRDDSDNGTCPAMPGAAGPGNGAAHRRAALFHSSDRHVTAITGKPPSWSNSPTPSSTCRKPTATSESRTRGTPPMGGSSRVRCRPIRPGTPPGENGARWPRAIPDFLLDRPADAGLIIPASWNPSTPCRAHTVAPLMTEPILAGNAIA